MCIVRDHLELRLALRRAGIDRHTIDALELAAPGHSDQFGVLRRDVDTGFKVGCLHFALYGWPPLNRYVQVANLLGILHIRSNHHRVGLLCQQLVLPGHDRASTSEPSRKDGSKDPALDGTPTD